ncbi:TRAP transporter small permease subunit [Biformimicrobium ophioploci]|uniref:TRAP transporter small permease protein n=1 Tax=Biformimicrobium ophioploci TaxID=3036711 RepID=A0ABQ6LVJ9_9GAMM|nr:TRAP transporter small permease subunit [Microbulbifer sp. NKW57]GMG86086.1 TRAP transporter small permease subunit [Microbulbifer sp. NKW57]
MRYLNTIERFSLQINRISANTGSVLGWFTLAMVALEALVVLLRYLFDSGSIALQESVMYLHGAVFLLGLAYALHTGAHVRVDIFYRKFSPRARAWVDAVGTLVFLLPLCGFIAFACWEFVLNSWAVLEDSENAGGLPGIFLLKTLLPLAATTLALQGLAELARCMTVLATVEAQPPSTPRAVVRNSEAEVLEV